MVLALSPAENPNEIDLRFQSQVPDRRLKFQHIKPRTSYLILILLTYVKDIKELVMKGSWGKGTFPRPLWHAVGMSAPHFKSRVLDACPCS